MTAAVLNLAVLVVVLLAGLPVLRRLRAWPLVGTAAVLCLLTAVFDTVMIAAGLYVYTPSKILGWYVLGAPVEDFGYALVAAVGVPVLWTVLGRRGRRGRTGSAAED